MDIEWIRAGLEKPGKSRVGLAKALGRSPSVVTHLLDGRRALKVREIVTIANYLECFPPLDEGQLRDSTPTLRYLAVTGEVAGGVWSEPQLEFERIETRVPVDPQWPAEGMYLLRVRGTSINRRAQDGDFVVCLDVFAAPRKFRIGDWVIAERQRNGLVETTVKRVGTQDGALVLFPDSTDPRFQDAIYLTDGDEENAEVQVRAFVLQFLKPATIF